MVSITRFIGSRTAQIWLRLIRFVASFDSKASYSMAAAGLVIVIGILPTVSFPSPPKPILAAQPALLLPFPGGYSSVLSQGTVSCGTDGTHCDTATLHDIDLDTPN